MVIAGFYVEVIAGVVVIIADNVTMLMYYVLHMIIYVKVVNLIGSVFLVVNLYLASMKMNNQNKILIGSSFVFLFIIGLNISYYINIEFGNLRIILELITIPMVLSQFLFFFLALNSIIKGN